MKKIFVILGSLIPSKAWAWGIAIIGSAIIAAVSLEIDFMEYATDGAAQTAWVTSATAYTAQYPPAHNDTYVKATTFTVTTYLPHFATDPALSLIGVQEGTQWVSEIGGSGTTNQRFHIDLGSAKIINRIYYENGHVSAGTQIDAGINNFTFWGSNTGAGSFDDLVYANDEGWTQITGLSQSTFDIHSAADAADPKYITISGNSTSYRYYAFKIADNHGAATHMAVRHLELQTVALNSFSESTIKTQGTYALKLVATTGALNETVTKTLTGGDILDLTGKNTIKFDARSTATGGNLELNIHDSGGTTSTHTITIASADTYQEESWDISGVADADKNAIDQLQLKVLNAGSARDFYVDNVRGSTDEKVYMTATGGTITTDGDYKVHTFLLADTGTDFTVTNLGDIGTVEYLVVAGGGGGGGNQEACGGGGAGGYRTTTGFGVASQAYPITVGAGGAINTNGGDSIFSSITSTGGGHGGEAGGGIAAGNGGSGGGGGRAEVGGTSTAYGNDGGTGTGWGSGGGGGSGAVGVDGTASVSGNGGNGTSSSITGSSIVYGGGGGGGGDYLLSRSVGGNGGTGGGGAGAKNATATAGTANTGGGGGGGGQSSSNTQNNANVGGSGIVIIRYQFQ